MTNLTKYQPRNNDELTIIEQRPNRIAKLDAKDAYRDVLNTISSLFPLYGIDGDVIFYSSVAKEIIQTFGQISSKEIEIAFRLFSAESLELDDDIKFYGKVNMHTIGKILNAYMVFRRRIIAAHDSEQEAMRINADMEERARQTKEDIYNNFPQMIKDFKGTCYDDLPLYWFDIATNLGLINYEEGEKAILWEKAKAAALEEQPEAMDLMTIRSHKRKLEQGNTSRAVVIAKKMVMWRKLFNKEIG